ncbi:hypothetical protein [Bacteriovorax sp. BSW11_IV]|uniref:hypothetical protein n=1 Tax=Bacteriovorax sp. BSW11_IV TaxID=1353529 RepID=UPI000409B067|nr:hypothetical protein [Bacteriovorax sp. BSW11_IV]
MATLNGKEIPCEMLEIRFIHEGDKLILRGGGYRCGDIQAEYPYSVFNVVDGELIYHGDKVGYISEHKLSLQYEEFSLNATMVDGLLYYNELWQSNEDYFQVLGMLSPN